MNASYSIERERLRNSVTASIRCGIFKDVATASIKRGHMAKTPSIHPGCFCDGRLTSFHSTRKANLLLKRADGVLCLLA